MNPLKIIITFIFLIATFTITNGQTRTQPKQIKVKEEYTHSSTKMSFPKTLFGEYQRESVYSFDKKNQNIGVTYEKNQNGEKTTFS